jgi:hypothetical protein
MKRSLLLMLALGCNGWSTSDTKSAQDSCRAQLFIEQMCGADAVDGGSADASECIPSRVRALERVSYCSNASMLARHGQAVPDGGGIQCQPP